MLPHVAAVRDFLSRACVTGHACIRESTDIRVARGLRLAVTDEARTSSCLSVLFLATWRWPRPRAAPGGSCRRVFVAS